MATIPQIVEKLEHLPPEALESVHDFVQTLIEANEPRYIAVTGGVAARMVPTQPDPPATGVWKKRSLADTDDW